MKKILSLFLALLIISSGVISCISSARMPNYAAPLYNYKGKIYSDAYALIDMDDPNFQVIASKNLTKRKYPASLTKIVTAMVVLNKKKNLNKKTIVRRSTLNTLNNTGAQIANLKAGQKLTIKQLLYLTMVYSACDASRVLADAVGRNNLGFVKKMNAWVRSIGCKNTHFVNPDGLHHSKHYTTVYDLRLIVKEACKNKTFLTIATKPCYIFNKTKFLHTNKMLHKSRKYEYYKFARGIKTGYTSQANHCVITFSKNGAKKYLIIALGAPLVSVNKHIVNGVYMDAKKLFNWSYKRLRVNRIIKANQAYTNIPIEQGEGSKTLTLCFKTGVNKLLYGTYDKKKILVRPINMPKSVSTPVKAGQKICNAQVYYNSVYVKTVPLITNKSVRYAR